MKRKKGKKMDVAGVAKTVKTVSEKLKAKKKKAALSSFRKKAVKKKPVNKKGLAKRKAIIKRVRKFGEKKVSASARKVPTAKLSTKGAVRKLNAASRKSMKADSKDMKRNKLAAELKKKLGAKKYEVLRTKKLKGLSVSDRKKVSEINRLYKSAARKRGAAKRKISKVSRKLKK